MDVVTIPRFERKCGLFEHPSQPRERFDDIHWTITTRVLAAVVALLARAIVQEVFSRSER